MQKTITHSLHVEKCMWRNALIWTSQFIEEFNESVLNSWLIMKRCCTWKKSLIRWNGDFLVLDSCAWCMILHLYKLSNMQVHFVKFTDWYDSECRLNHFQKTWITASNQGNNRNIYCRHLGRNRKYIMKSKKDIFEK